MTEQQKLLAQLIARISMVIVFICTCSQIEPRNLVIDVLAGLVTPCMMMNYMRNHEA